MSLKMTISKVTGLPLKWQSVLAGETQYELRFAPKTVVAVDRTGIELERWELLADEPAAVIPALEQGWGDFMLVEPVKLDSPLAKARDALRRGDNIKAQKLLENLLADRPRQPLLNFLFAWSIRVHNKSDAARAGALRGALDRLAVAGGNDLLCLVTPASFPSLGAGSLREILLMIPEDRRTEESWERLSQLAVELQRNDLALVEMERAIAVTTDPMTRVRRQISMIELLLANSRPLEAETVARELAEKGVSPMQLLELGDLFGRAELTTTSRLMFDQYRRTQKMSRRENSDLAFHQAAWLKKGELRWRMLIAADSGRSADQREFLDIVLSEADQPDDADILGKLASELKPGFVQTQLVIRQADLTTDTGRAADIALKLYIENRFAESRIESVIEIPDRDKRDQDVVEILERRLRKVGRIEPIMLHWLARAYERLGRDSDVRRVRTQFDG
jgi:hypothetical protein